MTDDQFRRLMDAIYYVAFAIRLRRYINSSLGVRYLVYDLDEEE